jgi:hypothetical protein
MNMESSTACHPYPGERVSPGNPVYYGAPPFTIRQQLRERAQRLYMMGELNLAAQLLLELAADSHPEQGECGGEAING